MFVVHTHWTRGRFRLWAESSGAFDHSRHTVAASDPPSERHPFALPAEELVSALTAVGIPVSAMRAASGSDDGLVLRLPAREGVPDPSPSLGALSRVRDSDNGDGVKEFRAVAIPCVDLDPAYGISALETLNAAAEDRTLTVGATVRYWGAVAGFASELLRAERFVPTLAHRSGADLRGCWLPWLHDNETAQSLSRFVAAMPPIARCAIEHADAEPGRILVEAVSALVDATIRRYLREDSIHEAVASWRDQNDPSVLWLHGLTGTTSEVRLEPDRGLELLRGVRQWIGRLRETARGQAFHLCLQLSEPDDRSVLNVADLEEPPESVRWALTFHLQSAEDAASRVPASKIWTADGPSLNVGGRRVDEPQALLLSELARAATMFRPLEASLAETAPEGLSLSTAQACTFMRQIAPLLTESGIFVDLPEWWGTPEGRMGVRLNVQSEDIESDQEAGFHTQDERYRGLDSLVDFNWQLVVGDEPLTPEQFRQISSLISPLVRFRGRWIEVRREDFETALRFLNERQGGRITIREALRLAYGTEPETTGLPVLGMHATGWVGRLFGEHEGSDRAMPLVPQPDGFRGTLRPYQVNGLSWLAFLQRLGFGACLADDMGLGKTIQIIALLQWERQSAPQAAGPGPTLLVVPTSVVDNWKRELARFAPELRVMIHHGLDRTQGDPFVTRALLHDVVITTYSLVYRDEALLGRIEWWRVCLDEAQNIKNPTTRQSLAIRALQSGRRVALTGTPVENRLAELWSIMDFCNPGHLGTQRRFRTAFALPIEKHHDEGRTSQLRGYVQPFILRRLKTDPHVIADLPEKIEQKVFCPLTAEQARLYEETVTRMLTDIDGSSGMARRGRVLSALIRLKQICNHPEHFATSIGRETSDASLRSATAAARRSGKCARLVEMLEEVLAEGDCALIFTQFKIMGRLLESIIRHELDTMPLFLHGSTPAGKRQEMIDRFQARDGAHPIFILSLKAGGFGVNLTAANHVFHFDRWWNPAVENQATDRAFRIGQTRRVQVHKLICSGTLEERIDRMLEDKTSLAANIIGSGESWLTELSTDRLREILTLRRDLLLAGDDENLSNGDDPTLTPAGREMRA